MIEREAVLDKITLANVGIDLKQTIDYHTVLLQKGADVRGRAEETARDLRSYESESLEDNVFSFYPYYIHEFEGRKRIFSADEPRPDFLAISQIKSAERDGAVIEGFAKIEEAINKIHGRGFFLWVSTDGESGMPGIKYPCHQIYMGEIGENTMQACALKSDIDAKILSEWLKRVSRDSVVLSDLSPKSFVSSPVVLELYEGQKGNQNALRILKEVLLQHNTDRFYKNVSIDKVIKSMQSERSRQEGEVRKLAEQLMPDFIKHGTDPDIMRRVIGGQLYNLYNRYRDTRGNVTLTGCGGGTKCINELFTGGITSGSGIFSTGFRAEFGTKTRDFKFDEKGPCKLCGSDAPCGPRKICEKCNDKIDSGELVLL